MPADYQVKYGALTEDKLFGNNAVYFWDGKVKTNETVEILQMYGELHFDSIEQKMMVKGSIAPVLTQNLNREFVGVCYAELVKGSDVDYLFATPNDNERTVVYVAQKSLDLGLVEEEQIPTVEGLISGYINAYKQANDNAMPTVSYTVNQIFDDGTATNQIVVNDAELDSTKQYQITAKAVNELLAKGFTKVKMTITLKDGEAFISCLSNAGGQVLSSKAKNTDSKTYTLTADTPILASFYIRKLNATEATNAGFSEVPPMTGFTVQLVGVK